MSIGNSRHEKLTAATDQPSNEYALRLDVGLVGDGRLRPLVPPPGDLDQTTLSDV